MSPTLHRLWGIAARWVAWWLHELSGLIPRRLAEALAGERNLLIVDVGPTHVVIKHRSGEEVREIARTAIPETGLPARPPALARMLAGRPRAIVRLAPDS